MNSRIRPKAESPEGRALLSVGALNTSFGGTRTVTNTFSNQTSHGTTATASAVWPDLKVGAAGMVHLPDAYHTSLTRYYPHGPFDATFGTGSRVVVAHLAGKVGNAANAVAIQTDSKLVGAVTVVNKT